MGSAVTAASLLALIHLHPTPLASGQVCPTFETFPTPALHPAERINRASFMHSMCRSHDVCRFAALQHVPVVAQARTPGHLLAAAMLTRSLHATCHVTHHNLPRCFVSKTCFQPTQRCLRTSFSLLPSARITGLSRKTRVSVHAKGHVQRCARRPPRHSNATRGQNAAIYFRYPPKNTILHQRGRRRTASHTTHADTMPETHLGRENRRSSNLISGRQCVHEGHGCKKWK
jgi:hypothetical protein